MTFSGSRPPSDRDGPALVSGAVANVSDPNLVPTGRDCTKFVFTHDEMWLTEEILPPEALVEARLYELAATAVGGTRPSRRRSRSAMRLWSWWWHLGPAFWRFAAAARPAGTRRGTVSDVVSGCLPPPAG